MRVLVTGSRDFNNDGMVLRELQRLAGLCGSEQFVVVHGCARGADTLAGKAADVVADLYSNLTVEVDEFPADWDGNGKTAGPIRNQEMADAGADICLAFSVSWPITTGTADMIARAHKAGIHVTIQVTKPEPPKPEPKRRKGL